MVALDGVLHKDRLNASSLALNRGDVEDQHDSAVRTDVRRRWGKSRPTLVTSEIHCPPVCPPAPVVEGHTFRERRTITVDLSCSNRHSSVCDRNGRVAAALSDAFGLWSNHNPSRPGRGDGYIRDEEFGTVADLSDGDPMRTRGTGHPPGP
jgi:hypothetical protein